MVGGAPRSRGVVCAASYDARRFGVHSAMPSAQAARLCPGAIFVAPDFAKYAAVSREVHAILHRFTDLIEPLSLDEAYLDVSENKQAMASATRVAEAIRAAIRVELRLTASAGVAPNKFLAKVASDIRKPDGLCVVRPEAVESFLAGLPVRRLPGVGPVTAERFARLGVELVPDIRRLPEDLLLAQFGKAASHFRELASGIDRRPVVADRERKSVGIEDTFETDIVAVDETRRRLEALARGLELRLARSGLGGRTVTLKVKYHDFRVVTRRRTLARRVSDAQSLVAVALELARETELNKVPVRLLGIALSQLDDPAPEQLRLPFDAEPVGRRHGP